MPVILRPRRTAIGLDLGAHSVKAVQLARAGTGWRITACADFPRTRSGQRPLGDEVAEISRVLARQGLIGQQVIVAAPREKLKTAMLELPPRGPGVPMEQLAQVEFSRIHKCDVLEMEMSFWDLPAPARAGKATHVLAAGYAHADADVYLDALEAGGLNVLAIDDHASAFARASVLFPGTATSTAVLDVGWTGSTLSLVRQGVLIYERRLADAALGRLHATICTDLGCDPELADQLLHHNVGPGTEFKVPDTDQIDQAISAHFEALLQEIGQSFAYQQHQYPDSPIERLLLCGGGACIPGFDQHLKGALHIDVRLASPDRAVQCDGTLQRRVSPALTPAMGLALFGR